MTLFHAALMAATFLCSLVAGLLFTFAVVVMPGTGRLNDREFIRSFQVIDRVIQNNQPLFVLVWVGSVLALLGAAVLGVWNLAGFERLLVIFAALLYVLGVQLPTAAINVPLNNRLQKLEVGTMDEMMRRRTRAGFEPRWNRWNAVRTACACATSLLLIFLLFRL